MSAVVLEVREVRDLQLSPTRARALAISNESSLGGCRKLVGNHGHHGLRGPGGGTVREAKAHPPLTPPSRVTRKRPGSAGRRIVHEDEI